MCINLSCKSRLQFIRLIYILLCTVMPSVLYCYRKCSDIVLKHNSPVEICIEFCIKHGKHFYCLYQAHYFYKIVNNSCIVKPKSVATILRKSYFFAKNISIFGTSEFYIEYFFTYIFPIHISLYDILYFGVSTKDTIISPKIVIFQLW